MVPDKEAVIEVLKQCYDPEIPIDIFELGLVYEVRISDDGVVDVDMTLTSPNCPAAQSLPAEVRSRILSMDGVETVNVEIVWDPPWSMEMVSDAGKLALGLM